MTPANYREIPAVNGYFELVQSGKLKVCKDVLQLISYLKNCFNTEELYVDTNRLEKYLGLQKYFPFALFPWERMIIALWLCIFNAEGYPRWPRLLCLIGRGAGKDGFIGFVSFCVMSEHNGITDYDVDICANNEEQAMRPVKDLIKVLERTQNYKKLRHFFKWNKEEITSKRTGAVMKGRTNSPKGKDGLRSGMVIFNEYHQYENLANINVFTTGLGKTPHPRRGIFTTQGDVREGPLDDILETSKAILYGGEADNGLLPFINRLDSEAEVHDLANWEKANPSLPHLPALRIETQQEYVEWAADKNQLPAFMTKRMNLPQTATDVAVTDYANIKATNRELPDMDGWSCVCGIDFVHVSDFASVDLHFRNGEQRMDINHSWLCAQSKDIPRIKAPWQQWARDGYLTVVDDVEVHPELLTEYIYQSGLQYNIVGLAIDHYRLATISPYLETVGFSKDRQNMKIVRPSDVMQVSPIIDRCFNNQFFIWGNNPVLRWATNNTKRVRSSKKIGADTGNYYYAKIEAKSRKTDPFMALVAAMTIEDQIIQPIATDIPIIPMLTW